MSELLQLTITIDEDKLGPLITAALKLNAKIDALGLIEEVPTYHKNAPRDASRNGAQLVLPAPSSPAPPLRQRKSRRTELPPGMQERIDAHNARKRRAYQAVEDAVAAAGPDGLDREAAQLVYTEADGDPRGFGNVARFCFKEKRKRLFLLLPQPRGGE